MSYSPKYIVVLASTIICLSLFFNLSHAQTLPSVGGETHCDYNSAITNAKDNWWTVDRLKTETPSTVRSLIQSSDGAHPTKWIVTAFQAFVDDNWEIFRSDGSDSEGSNISNNAFNDVRPRISPDGKQIVFVSDRDGNDEVYKMNTDGLGLQRLTDNAILDTMPVWSPDGQKILFVSKREGNAALYTMAVDGSNITRLTNNEVDNAFPTWSPDGKFIAWVQISGADRKLWIMNADGSNPHAITGALKSLQNLVWIPSRNEIAFDFDPDGFRVENHLAQIAIDGSNFRLLNESFDGDELWLSGWSEFDQYFLVTKVHYNCATPNDETVTQQQAGIIYPSEGAGFNPRYFTYYSAMLHQEKLDKLPPVTRIDPLPAFSRSSGLAIEWSGFDLGPSGIASVSVLMKSKNYPPWATEPQWVPYDPSAIPYLEDVIYLKSFGVDDAGNVEPIHAEADTQTQTFDWLVAGQIMDNRGHPVPNWDVPISPPSLNEVRTNPMGTYTAYRRGITAFTFNEKTNIDTDGDTTFDHYLEPTDNVILNGDFENIVTNGWVVNDKLLVAQSNTRRHNGNGAVQLGIPCGPACLPRISLASSVNATTSIAATISQNITIPSGIHSPTLAFMYQMDDPVKQNTLFEVSVSEGVSHTQVFSSSTPAPWQLGWADMTPWSGHSVTVTFSLHQAISDTVAALYVDDISLGSWRTSVLQSVSPDHVEANQSATLAISGENFIPTPKVTIGTTLLTDVRWIDENHLEATIPSTLAPGFHDLAVTNEGGVAAVKLSAIGIGKQVYLPVIAR